jgi:hypothetical protein
MRFQTPKDKEIWERRRRASRGMGKDRPLPRPEPSARDAIGDFRRSMAGDGGAGLRRATRAQPPPAPSKPPPVRAPLERATLKPQDPEIALAGAVDGGRRPRAILRHGLIFAGIAIVIAIQGGLLIAALRDDGPDLDAAVHAALRDGGAPVEGFGAAERGNAAGPLLDLDPVPQVIAPVAPEAAPAQGLDAGRLADVVEPPPAPEPALTMAPAPDPVPPDRPAEAAPEPDVAAAAGLQIAPQLDIAEPERAASLPEPAAGPGIPEADAADLTSSDPEPPVPLEDVAGQALAQLLGEAKAGVEEPLSAGPIELVTFAPAVMPTSSGASGTGIRAAEPDGTLVDAAALAMAQLTGGADAPPAIPPSGDGARELSVALAASAEEPAGGSAMPPAAASGPRVFVHYTAFEPGADARARRLASYLQTRGFRVADLRAVRFSIPDSSIRYFFERDLEQASALRDDLSEFFGNGGEPVEIEDFTHFRPKPAQGNLEVWLPST